MGGDLHGLKQSIAEGLLDQLVCARSGSLRFKPIRRVRIYRATRSQGTGYHGYWPIRGRRSNLESGGNGALRDMCLRHTSMGFECFRISLCITCMKIMSIGLSIPTGLSLAVLRGSGV